MEIKNIIKKGASIRDTFLIIIISVFCFVAFFSFITQNAQESNISIPSNYNDSYNSLLEKQGELNESITAMRDLIPGIDETQQGDYGFFGLKGVLALMKAPFSATSNILNIGLESLNLGFSVFDFLPANVLVSITLAVTVIVVFAVITFITQRGKEP